MMHIRHFFSMNMILIYNFDFRILLQEYFSYIYWYTIKHGTCNKTNTGN